MGLKEELAEKQQVLTARKQLKMFSMKKKMTLKKLCISTEKKEGVLMQFKRKLFLASYLFAVATGLLYWGAGLDAETWGMIAMTYIGGQTAIDFAKVWRGA